MKLTKLEKRLQAEVEGLKQLVDVHAGEAAQAGKDLAAALQLITAQHKRIGELEFHYDRAHAGVENLSRENQLLKASAEISASGMAIERDELVARAARLTMRIQGLEPDVQ